MISYRPVEVGLNNNDLNEEIYVALANFPVLESNIEASYLGKAVTSQDRLKTLNTLLNDVLKYNRHPEHRVDLLVFPEVSIPYAWQQMLVSWSRKNQIGVICGLEHRVDRNRYAYNKVLAALPYRSSSRHLACLPIHRLKIRYSPHEKFVLREENLKVPSGQGESYHLYRWRGATFAIYNCYELTDISHRSLFVGKVDFIVCTEYNKDVNYFSNIVESAARDIHCYVIQVNDSKFGDSRIVSPSPTIQMNPLRIKGGENVTFLVMKLDLKSLREHQRKGYGLQKDSKTFKPTPPGLKRSDVIRRSELGEK